MNMKNLKTKFLFTISLFMLLPFMAFAHPDMEPSFIFNTEAGTTELSADEVFQLSLLFSECPLDSPEGEQCLKQFEQLKQKVTDEAFITQTPEELGRAVLKLLYQDVLTTYDFNQTRTDIALQTGVYNCVSSALLYMAVAKAAGLEVRGQKTSEHAFCTVYIPGSKAGQFTKPRTRVQKIAAAIKSAFSGHAGFIQT